MGLLLLHTPPPLLPQRGVATALRGGRAAGQRRRAQLSRHEQRCERRRATGWVGGTSRVAVTASTDTPQEKESVRPQQELGGLRKRASLRRAWSWSPLKQKETEEHEPSPILLSTEAVLPSPSSLLLSLAVGGALVTAKTALVLYGHQHGLVHALAHLKDSLWTSVYHELHPYYCTARHVLLRFWHWYERGEKKHPWEFSVGVTGLTYFMADIISQNYGGRKFDPARLCSNLVVGGLILGPFMRSYYLVQDELMAPYETFVGLPLFKIALDQTLYASAYNCIYLTFIDLLKGMSPEDIKADVAKNNIPMLKAGWKLWPMVHMLTYTVIPKQHKQLWVCLVEIVWASYLSFVANEKRSETIEVIEAFAGSPSSTTSSTSTERKQEKADAVKEVEPKQVEALATTVADGPVMTALDAKVTELTNKAAALVEEAVEEEAVTEGASLDSAEQEGFAVEEQERQEVIAKTVLEETMVAEEVEVILSQSVQLLESALEEAPMEEAQVTEECLLTVEEGVLPTLVLDGPLDGCESMEEDEETLAVEESSIADEEEANGKTDKVLQSGVDDAPTFAMTKAVEVESYTQVAVGQVLEEMIDACPAVEVPEPLANQLKEMTESVRDSEIPDIDHHLEIGGGERRAVAERMDKVATNLSDIIVELTAEEAAMNAESDSKAIEGEEDDALEGEADSIQDELTMQMDDMETSQPGTEAEETEKSLAGMDQ